MAKRITELTSTTVLTETDLLPVVDISDTTQATSGTTKKSALSLIADYIKTRVETLTNKTLSTGSVIDTNVDIIEVLKKVYPVGSIYTNAGVSTNPATLLGFGTWSAFGAGKVMVGIDSTDEDFNTAGETGGEKTHTLTVAEMPTHNHNITRQYDKTGFSTPYGEPAVGWSLPVGDASATNMCLTTSAGGGSAHNNLQPYIVVYMWKRVS